MFLFESKTGLHSTCELSNGYKIENNPVWVTISDEQNRMIAT